jgi:hypothetical protein
MSTRKVRNLPARKVRNISREVVMNPSKGLNNLGSPSLIDNKEWADLQNIEFTEGGVAEKRSGYTTYSGALTAAKGLGQLKTDSINHICTIDGTSFKYTTGSSYTTVGSISFTAGLDVNFVQAKGLLYIWNGSQGGASWDGTTLSRPGTMPAAKYSVYFKSFHIAAGTPTKSSRLYVAELSNPSDFTNISSDPDPSPNDNIEVPGATVFDAGTGADFIDIQPDDGDIITGIGVFSDYIIVYKQFASYQVVIGASGIESITPITRAAGCIAGGSVVPVENDLYFLSRQGVRVLGNEANFFSAIRTNILSKPIDPIIQAMLASAYNKASGVYFNNQYILSIPNAAGQLNTVIVYNKQFQSWTRWTDINAANFLRIVDSSNEEKLLFLNTDGTQVYEFTPGVYSDDGQPISAYMLSKVFDFKSPDITKYFVDLGLVFRTISGEITLAIYTEGDELFGGTVGIAGSSSNDGMGYTMLGYAMFGTGGGDDSGLTTYTDLTKRVVINTNSTSIRFRLENSRNNENFVLLGYINAFYPYGHYLFDSADKIYL